MKGSEPRGKHYVYANEGDASVLGYFLRMHSNPNPRPTDFCRKSKIKVRFLSQKE